jgi:hypothetical protein
MRKLTTKLFALLLAAACGCSGAPPTTMDPGQAPGNGAGGGGGPDGGTTTTPSPSPNGLLPGVMPLSVSGQIVDFVTLQPLSQPTMLTNGMSPAPMVTVSGADFTVMGIPPFSLFYLLAGGSGYVNTFSLPVAVKNSDLTGVSAPVVSTQYLTGLATAFNVQLQAGAGTLFARVLDQSGAPLAGVQKLEFKIGGMPANVFFLDGQKQAAPQLNATSSSGWVVLFNLTPGTLQVEAGVQLSANIPIAAGAASMAELGGVAGMTAPQPPSTPQSFKNDIMPIFTSRGCVNCHSGMNEGRAIGGLALTGGEDKIWQALTQDISPNWHTPRVNLQDPTSSLVLQMPLYHNPANAHPVAVFPSTSDPDYLKMLAWVMQGALKN